MCVCVLKDPYIYNFTKLILAFEPYVSNHNTQQSFCKEHFSLVSNLEVLNNLSTLQGLFTVIIGSKHTNYFSRTLFELKSKYNVLLKFITNE